MTSPMRASRRVAPRVKAMWLAAYLVALAVIVFSVLHARDTTLRDMDTPEARAQWQAWRDAEPNQVQNGPVSRRPPSAAEPPAVLLMRDHFVVVMSGAVIFGSLLFVAIAFTARGAMIPDEKRSHRDGGS